VSAIHPRNARGSNPGQRARLCFLGIEDLDRKQSTPMLSIDDRTVEPVVTRMTYSIGEVAALGSYVGLLK
jgi:hypothetical protein